MKIDWPMLANAFDAGAMQLGVWADLLDRINVFPVADGDTGRNLVVSLAPLRTDTSDPHVLTERLLLNARGNSGNIAARFFMGFIEASPDKDFATATRAGRDQAWLAVRTPVKGTILSLFDALADFPLNGSNPAKQATILTRALEHAVRKSPEQLEELGRAGVVDAGALGMYIFFDAFFHSLWQVDSESPPVTELFEEWLDICESYDAAIHCGTCIDAVVESSLSDLSTATSNDDSVVGFGRKKMAKLHFHANDGAEAREKLEKLGHVVRFSYDDIGQQTREFKNRIAGGPIHIMTDAAGSVTSEDAAKYRMTVLASRINLDGVDIPEIYMEPERMYEAMRGGVKISTSQASDYERHQHYLKSVELYPQTLYLCVGSVYTGNHDTVTRWVSDNEASEKMNIIDTGAASGRLGLMALTTARMALEADNVEQVLRFAQNAVAKCKEFVFLDKLHYLAAGGRISKAGAFFGDLLHVKPIVSPLPDGVSKLGVARNREDQIRFAINGMNENMEADSSCTLLLQYTDNETFVRGELSDRISQRFSEAEVLIRPLSLTSGAHMGPGTWALAFLPRPFESK